MGHSLANFGHEDSISPLCGEWSRFRSRFRILIQTSTKPRVGVDYSVRHSASQLRTHHQTEILELNHSFPRGTSLAEAVQSLASGEVDVGAAMMKHWLKVGSAMPKDLLRLPHLMIPTVEGHDFGELGKQYIFEVLW